MPSLDTSPAFEAGPAGQEPPAVDVRGVTLSYGGDPVVRDVSLRVPDGKITIIVGANGSGKSTLLRGMSRLLTPTSGEVLLHGRSIASQAPRQVARHLGLLPQHPIAPSGITVRDLVGRGRFPHHGLLSGLGREDHAAVDRALEATGMTELADRVTEELSGGQRQRAWIAMALAQETDVLLLDEPTTYLDVAHQLDVLEVVRELNRDRGTTVVIVLHELNLAARYADHLVAMKDGRIHAEGAPSAVITPRMVREVFTMRARVMDDPATGTPMVIPLGRMEDMDERTALPGDARLPAVDLSPTLAFRLRVARTRWISPSFLRLTLTGEDLRDFGVQGQTLDLRVKLIVPGARDMLTSLHPDAQLTSEEAQNWYKSWLITPEDERGAMRTYTVRALRPAGSVGNLGEHAEIDIDVVAHEGGRASEWAIGLQVGDAAIVLGPNQRLLGPDYGGIEFRPGAARHLLLAGDATAVPAISAILETLSEDFSGHAVMHVPSAADRLPIATRSQVQVHWLIEDELAAAEGGAAADGGTAADSGAADGDTAADAPPPRLLPAVQSLLAPPPLIERPHGAEEPEDVDVDTTLLWESAAGGDSPFYAWIAGEAGEIKLLRRYLVRDVGIDRRQVAFMGYWRRGRAEG